MTQYRRAGPTVLSLLLFVVVLFSLQIIRSQENSRAAQAVGLAQQLLLRHPYLLSPNDTELLRETVTLLEQGSRDAGPETAEILGRLVQILRHFPVTITLSPDREGGAFQPVTVLRQPGDSGAALVIVPGKTEEPEFELREYDFSKRRDPVTIETSEDRTQYLLLNLIALPPGQTSLPITILTADHEPVSYLMRIQAPEPARLIVRIESKETRRSFPAMVSLVWKKTGLSRPPGNFIDFSAQLDGLGNPGSARTATLPGESSERLWWCVPGSFDMQLPPGEWELVVRKGTEYQIVRDNFTADSGQEIRKTYGLGRWTNLPSQGWYSGDAHVHARISSDLDAEKLLQWIEAEDVHLANILEMGDVYRTWFQQRGFGPDHRSRNGEYILAPGQECPRTHADGFGHTLSLNITKRIRDVQNYFLYDLVSREVQAQGGLFGFAHAYHEHPYVWRGMTLTLSQTPVQMAEILQMGTLGTDLYYEFLNLGFKITAVAGSDVPFQGTIGEVRTYAHLGYRAFSADNWFDAVERGRTFVTNGPTIHLQVEDAGPGDQIDLGTSRPLKVQASVSQRPNQSNQLQLEVIASGEILRRVKGRKGENRDHLSLDFEAELPQGGWIAARASGSDGSLAHTTPVYVVRNGLRFWKFLEAGQLIQRRLATIQQIEELVEDSMRKVQEDIIPRDWSIDVMAAQAQELKLRLREARRFYDRLRFQLEDEAPVRSRLRD